MNNSTPTHAIVIGGSMAGLFAGRVLADHFDRVTIIERDHFPETPEVRKGVPQAHHLHLLLGRGRQILDHLFPGLTDELAVYGAASIDLAEDAAFLLRSGWTPRFRSGILSYGASRFLLEWGIQRRLAAHPSVTFMEGAQVTQLLTNDAKTRVTGVRVRHRRAQEAESDMQADLVVDASGRSTDTPDWLQGLGYERPQETVVNSFLGYATRWYRRPANLPAQWRLLFINGRPPDVPRGGAIYAVEGDQWVVTLAGASRDYPPTDEKGFLEFARSLLSPALYEAIKDAEPVSPIYGYQRTANQRRHFERLARWPDNFAVMGDAACAFNPIYGQGMSLAAMGAMALDECLRDGRGPGMGQRFQKRLAKATEGAWLLATGEDFRYPATEGGQRTWMTRFSHWYIDRVTLALPSSMEIVRTFTEIAHLLKPPTTLFHPRIMAETLRYLLANRGKKPQLTFELSPEWQIEQKVSTF